MSDNDDVRRMSAVAAATRLVDKGCKGGNPGSDPVYKALLNRHAGDADMRMALAQVAEGRDILVHEVSPTYGLTVTAKEGCEWAMTLSKVDGWTYSPQNMRAVLGAVIPFVAATFYPTDAALQDLTQAPDPLPARAIRAAFSAACDKVRAAHPEERDDALRARGSEAALKAWQIARDLPAEAGPSRERRGDRFRIRKIQDLDDAVDVAIKLLLDWGYLRQQATDRFYPTRRFQIAARETLFPAFYAAAREAANPQG